MRRDLTKNRKKYFTPLFLLVSAFFFFYFASMILPFEFPWSDGYFSANVVGVSTSILPNEQNTRVAELENKRKELAEKEALLAKKEKEINELLSAGKGAIRKEDVFGAAVSALLFTLLAVNFYLDLKRKKIEEPSIIKIIK
jgi:hypothetical protein